MSVGETEAEREGDELPEDFLEMEIISNKPNDVELNVGPSDSCWGSRRGRGFGSNVATEVATPAVRRPAP